MLDIICLLWFFLTKLAPQVHVNVLMLDVSKLFLKKSGNLLMHLPDIVNNLEFIVM